MRGPMDHLDPEVLAEFEAGLITGHRAAPISAHLAACEQCTTLGEQLAGVSALLLAVPAAAMPDQVAERLDTVLAAEVARREQTEGAGARLGGNGTQPARDEVQPAGAGTGLNGVRTGPNGKGSRDRERRTRPSWHRNLRPIALRVLAPAAVVALLVGFGYSLSLGGSTSSSATSSGAAPANRSVAGGTAAGQGSQGASGANVPAAAPLKTPHRTSPAAFPVVAGTADFLRASLRQQVEAALRVPAKERQTQASSTAIRACVQALAGSKTPVLVESARYQGQPATLVVLQTGSSDTALVAGSRCSAADHDVLDRTTVPSGISGP